MAIRQRNDPVRLFGRRLMLFALLMSVGAASWGLWGAYDKERESAGLRAQAEGQRGDLEKRRAELDSDIATLQTQRGVEEVLREQYSLASKDEGLIVIVDQQAATSTEATSTVLDTIKKAFWW